MKKKNGYTLIELMVAISLFAIIMVLAAGAYFMMINLSRQAQAISTAVDSVSFSMEYMTRSIRTGSAYGCGASPYVDCAGGLSTFSVLDQTGTRLTFSLTGGTIYQGASPLTDPSISVSTLMFYVTGTKPVSQGDYLPPHVTIVVSGTVTTGKGVVLPFSVESGATMRGIDISAASGGGSGGGSKQTSP